MIPRSPHSTQREVKTAHGKHRTTPYTDLAHKLAHRLPAARAVFRLLSKTLGSSHPWANHECLATLTTERNSLHQRCKPSSRCLPVRGITICIFHVSESNGLTDTSVKVPHWEANITATPNSPQVRKRRYLTRRPATQDAQVPSKAGCARLVG